MKADPRDREAWNREYEEQVAAQTKALAEIGFGPAFDMGGGPFFASRAATCETCGAMVYIGHNDSAALLKHQRWHKSA